MATIQLTLLPSGSPLEPARKAGPCSESPDGQHVECDLSELKLLPSPPFCVWCGLGLEENGWIA